MLLNRNKVVIVADPTEATYVNFGLEELRGIFGIRAEIANHWHSDVWDHCDLIIAVGRNILEQIDLPNLATDRIPGPDGYIISIHHWKEKKVIALAGSDPQGTKYALLDLIRSAEQNANGIILPDDFYRFEKPHFRIRAMYGHLHWQYNYPYASRSWGVEDWKNYIDILSYMGCNVLQIWPMLCLMLDPLSSQDEQYLSMFASVVNYAHDCRGMQIWVGECCNNVASTDWGTPIQRREYFGTEKLLNPSDPLAIQELMSARSNLYRCIPNADGYWIIDSDPGSWKGSPSSEFVDIFIRNQSLMKQYNRNGAQMIYWMLWGWGNGSREENWESVLAGLSERLEEPWRILMHPYPGQMEIVKRLGLSQKVVYFPYGAIEPEPGTPVTLFNISTIKEHIDFAMNHGLDGYMVQAQTPIVQFPNIYYAFRCLWNPEYRHKEPSLIFKELAHILTPQHSEKVALAWSALMSGDVETLEQAREELEEVLKPNLSQGSTIGLLFFGNSNRIMEDLVALLKIRENGERFRMSVHSNRPLIEHRHYFYNYIQSTLRWHIRHNYNAMGGNKYLYGPYLESGAEGWRSYMSQFDRTSADFDLHWPIKSRLIQEGEFHPALIDNVILEVIT